MTEREIHREYIAIVEGEDLADEGTVDLPLGRKENSAIKRMVDYENGEKAVTHYKVLGRRNGLALLLLKLETGRTHQIRVHLSEIGYPVVGDEVYSNGKNPFGVKGQLLHAKELKFKHPVTNQELSLEAQLPEEFKNVILN